jgi:hypothetical protein
MEEANSSYEIQMYAEGWRILLRELLGWPKEKIESWVEREVGRMADNPFLTHESECWYIVPLLVPQELNEKLGPRLNSFWGTLDVTIGPYFVDSFKVPNYDWEPARRAVKKVTDEEMRKQAK